MGPLIRPVHNRCVGPFEIERIDKGFAHALVLEFLQSGVEKPALCCRRRMVGDDVALNEAVADRGKVVAGRPYQRDQLLAKQIALARKTLEGGIAIAIVFANG